MESEVESDMLFRIGETRQGEPTRTPRAVVLDVKGALGALSKRGSLYESVRALMAGRCYICQRASIAVLPEVS